MYKILYPFKVGMVFIMDEGLIGLMADSRWQITGMDEGVSQCSGHDGWSADSLKCQIEALMVCLEMYWY